MNSVFSNCFVVILAGGSGTRFWPQSRQKLPKQLCHIVDPHKTMLEITLERVAKIIPPSRQMIVTHNSQIEKTREIINNSDIHLLSEPLSRNTAAALALASLEIAKLTNHDPATTMISVHADHQITHEKLFFESLESAVITAQQQKLVLLGIKPRHPETGYGYIQKGDALNIDKAKESYRVTSFKEKPDKKLAQDYIESGEYYWNSGMFVWKVATIKEAFHKLLPAVYQPLQKLYDEHFSFSSAGSMEKLSSVYQNLPKIAVDDGILEKSKHIAVICCHFGWEDIGSWSALDQSLCDPESGNVLQGDTLTLETRNSVVYSRGPLVATYGLDNMIVVATGDAVLVCPKEKAQEVKKIVEELDQAGRHELL